MGKPIKTRTIKVVKGGSRSISTARLKIARDQLFRARVLGSETHISFNFLQKLIDEILRLRREDEILMSEIDDILTEFGQQPDDDLCMLCGGPCHCLSGSSEDTTRSYISSADILIEELDELLIPSRSEPEYDYEDLEVKSLSELDTARLPVINDGRKRCKARKVEPRKRWSWPL